MKRARFLLPMSLLGCALAAPLAYAKASPRHVSDPAPSPAVKIYDKWCSDCHTRPSGPGTMALQRKYQGAVPAMLDQRTDLTPDYVRAVIRSGISFMPSFRKTEISDAELAQLADYLAPAPGSKRPANKIAGSKRK